MSDKLDEALRAAGVGLQARLEREMFAAFNGGMTNTVSAPPPVLTADRLKGMLLEFDKLKREMRRTQLTVTVDAAHEGPAIWYDHPHDGRFAECSPLQAREIHRILPLKLVEVENEWRAVFRPAISFGGMADFAPASFLLPPWDLPPEPDSEAE